jgi:hypothetical protein
MSRCTMPYRSLFLSFAAMLLAGCHAASDALTEPTSPATPAPSAVAQSSEAKAAPATSPAPGDEHKNAPPQPVAKNFTPPFPDRADLFEPPHNSASVAHREEEHGSTVELKGFVNVNGEQVVLAIDGVISPIPEGGEKYGVQVISIKPPSVVLQRGRSRWTASLE